MPRHPPIALTSRLRIHTTIDRPVLLAGCDYRWFGLFGTIMVEDMIEPTQLDNHCCFNTYERIASTLARTAALFIHAVTASISRTHSQCQRGACKPHIRGRSRETVCFISGNSLPPLCREPGDKWWSQSGSNRRPQACKASALPTELWPHWIKPGDGGPSRS
jgi:hypothetical protein